jgi:hypothetical protein
MFTSSVKTTMMLGEKRLGEREPISPKAISPIGVIGRKAWRRYANSTALQNRIQSPTQADKVFLAISCEY